MTALNAVPPARCSPASRRASSFLPTAQNQAAIFVEPALVGGAEDEPRVVRVGPPPKPHPMSRRFAFSTKSFFPIWSSNLRNTYRRKRKRKLGKGKSGSGGLQKRHMRGSMPHSRTWEGGTAPLFRRVPKWPAAHYRMKHMKEQYETLNLSKLRYFIEKGRLDTRFPITQRHLYESRCIRRIRNGVTLFNVNDFPFPYKLDIEVASADQSSIDMIKAVGGTVTIVYMERVALRAHVKPWKYEVLPRTARPKLKMVHHLEKMKARGCLVRYIKPMWLIEEEMRLQTQLRELKGTDSIKAIERLARQDESFLGPM